MPGLREYFLQGHGLYDKLISSKAKEAVLNLAVPEIKKKSNKVQLKMYQLTVSFKQNGTRIYYSCVNDII